MKSFFKKNWSNVLFVIVILLLIIPQTRMPIQVFFTRLISFSPSETATDDQKLVESLDWELTSMNDLPVNLSASEGKVILINFWATWCPPCIAEMPSMQNLYNEYGAKVDFYFVSAEEKQILEKFLQKKGYSIPVFQYRTAPPTELESKSIPATYVISKNGSIVIKKIGPADWDSDKVKEILDTLLAE